MLRQLLGISLAFLFLVLVGSPAQGQKKKKDAPTAPAADLDADYLPPGDHSGKLLSAPLPSSSFILEMTFQSVTQKQGTTQNTQTNNTSMQLTRELQRINQLENQIARARTPQQAAQYTVQLQQAVALAQLYQQKQGNAQGNLQVTSQKKTVEFHAGDDIIVRRLNLPSEYDDKGQPKKYSAEELRKLRGNKPNLPGYEAKLEDLMTGTLVKVTTVAKTKPASSTKKEDKDAADAPKTSVTMIVILGDDPNAKTQVSDKANPKKK